MENDFEEMVSMVVDDGMEESAVVSNYFLIHYPYLQGHFDQEEQGYAKRFELTSQLSEEKE